MKLTLSWTDGHNREVRREVNQVIDIRDFIGTPGYAWLVMAANPHLSAPDLERFIKCAGVPRCERSAHWIRRRRWMFQPDRNNRISGPKPNADGLDEEAFTIMRGKPDESLRNLASLLKAQGIHRSREWIRRWRCEVSADNYPYISKA